MKKSIKLLMTLSLVFSACSAIPKPAIDGCIINAPNENRKCYNFATDFNDDGSLKAGAVPKYHVNATVNDLNKAFILDSDYDDSNVPPNHYEDALAALKAYIKQLRTEYDRCESQQSIP